MAMDCSSWRVPGGLSLPHGPVPAPGAGDRAAVDGGFKGGTAEVTEFEEGRAEEYSDGSRAEGRHQEWSQQQPRGRGCCI